MSSHAYKIDIVVDIINSLLDSQTKLKDQTKSIFLKRWWNKERLIPFLSQKTTDFP